MSAINSINQAQSAVEKNIQQLSSGKRINSAADNPAGFAIASQMSVKISSTGQALSNIDNGISMLETASSGLGQVAETLQTIRDLTVQSGNGILNADDRAAIQKQIQQNIDSIKNISQTNNYNGKNLLDGSFSTSLQTGPNAGDTQAISIANNSPSALGIDAIDISNPSQIASTIDKLDNALNQVNKQQSGLGGMMNGLQSQVNVLNTSSINLASAQSSIESTDFAETISQMSQNNLQLQASAYAMKAHNDSQKTFLSLLA